MRNLLLERSVRVTYARNRIRGTTPAGVAYDFHCPDADKFPAQFSWDSCWHAIAVRLLDPAAARAELRTLVRGIEPNGLLPHTLLWYRDVRLSRAFIYNLQHPRDRATRTTQPPFEAMAWEMVADASPDDPGFRGEATAALAARHAWLARERDPDGSGLVAIIAPDESGLDASPAYDAPLGWRAAGLPGFVWHIQELRRSRFRMDAVLARGGFCAQDVLVTTAHALSLRALARLSGNAAHDREAQRIEEALIDHCWDEERGLFFNRLVPSGKLLRVSTWASLAPLALPGLPRSCADRLAEHVADPRRYALPYPVPSTAADEPGFQRRTGLIPRYWRGSTWIATSWLVHRGLVQHGYLELAREIAQRTVRLVAGHGLREYHDPVDGTPQGARGFGMSALALDLELWLRESG